MTFDATLFKSEGSNLIQQQSPPPKWVNTGSYTHTGYELAWTWLPKSNLETGFHLVQGGLEPLRVQFAG